jgi:putative cardiolipin synthase
VGRRTQLQSAVLSRILAILFACALLSGCAAPQLADNAPASYTWPSPQTTSMGGFFGQYEELEDGLSGLRLLSRGRDAFAARYAFAGQAERTIDLQYYLWKRFLVRITGWLPLENEM